MHMHFPAVSREGGSIMGSLGGGWWGGRTAYRAGAGRGGKVRGGRRQAGWPTANALNLTDGEG